MNGYVQRRVGKGEEEEEEGTRTTTPAEELH